MLFLLTWPKVRTSYCQKVKIVFWRVISEEILHCLEMKLSDHRHFSGEERVYLINHVYD